MLLLAVSIAVVGVANADAFCTIDVQGADDLPGQKDATRFCNDGSCGGTSFSLAVALDDRSWSGANTGDACMLFDTDGDGFANRAICGTLTGAGVLQAGSPTCYTCGDTRPDRCTSSVAVACTTTCSATATADPFAADPTHVGGSKCNGTNCLTLDTSISCCVTEADRGGAGGVLIDACSYPSQQPNSDPSDCVVTRECKNDTVCGDNNPCTVDTCNTTVGVCVHTAGNGGVLCRGGVGVCDVAEYCTGSDINCPADEYAQSGVCRPASDACDAAESCDGSGVNCPNDGVLPGGICRPSSGQCDVAESCNGSSKSCPPDGSQPNNTPCSDGDNCTSGDVCIGGQCTPGGGTTCNDGNACTNDVCDPQTGCGTTPVVCNDNNACTTDSCNPQTGCTATPVVCNDNNACTNDVCDPQTGCGTTPVVCNDNNACTTDSCDPQSGCETTPVVCNDNNACTNDICDPVTGCGTTPVVCNDGNACTNDVCNAQTGCGTTPVVCDDGNACTNDICDPVTGCGTTPVVCDDGDPCTVDTCNAQTGCASTPMVCADDGLCCNGAELCVDGQCVHGGNPCPGVCTGGSVCECGCVNDSECDDDNACTADQCNAQAGTCSNTPIVCDDGNACTGDVCDPQTGCGTTPVVCNDGNACTNDVCDPQTGCGTTPVVCNDGDACTTDSCDSQTGCGTTPVVCNDGNACTNDVCDPQTGCGTTPVVCNDGSACTTDSCDPQSGCETTPVVCDDHDACTNDVCDPQTGCGTTPVVCDDGNACTTDSCDPQSGCTTAPVACDDGNACTNDVCDRQTGCGTTPVVCDDGNACTTDSCDPGSGCETTPVVCEDNNGCTTDTCNPQTGLCDFTANDDPCEDGLFCTGPDFCFDKACQAGPVNPCNDHLACTDDACVEPVPGGDPGHCEHAPVDHPCCDTDAECADEDGCTINEACVGNSCVSEQVVCAESPTDDPCTIDSCTSLSAQDYKCENTDCNDLNACPPSNPECVPLTCGNTILEPANNETCDPPGSNTLPNGNPCRANCTYCGDGVKNGDEACDDGNNVTGCDPTHPQQAADACQNDCTVALCKDPAKITLAEWMDRYDVHGRLPSSTLVDFANRPLVIELTDRRGNVLYRTALRPGSLVGEAAIGKFKYGNKGAKAWGGLGKLKISRHKDGYRLTATTYGNLFASGADMITNVYSGGDRWTVHGVWKPTKKGWKFIE